MGARWTAPCRRQSAVECHGVDLDPGRRDIAAREVDGPGHWPAHPRGRLDEGRDRAHRWQARLDERYRADGPGKVAAQRHIGAATKLHDTQSGACLHGSMPITFSIDAK